MPSAAEALGQGVLAVAVAALFLALGRLLAGAVLGRAGLDEIDLWGVALPGACAFAFTLMLAHAASGGRVLSDATAARAITVAALLLLAWRERARRVGGSRGGGRKALWVSASLLAALLVWGSPVFRMVPLGSTGDVYLHTGWTNEILNGEPLPTAAITGDVPNFYPWLFHAVLGVLTNFTLEARAHLGLAPLQLLQVGGVVLTLFALGRSVGGRLATGAAGALLCCLSGGMGFVLARGPDVVLQPRAEGMRYLGDLIYKRSYNAAFYDLVPPFPRDLSWSLMAGALLLLMLGSRHGSRILQVASGATLGLAGLTGAESFLVGVGVTLTFIALAPGKRSAAAYVLLPALAVYAVWFVPQVVNYVRLGGYVNLTLPAFAPVTYPAHAIAVAWGVSLPLGLVGLARCLPRARRSSGCALAVALLAVPSLAVIACSAVPALFGPAFDTLGRAHRYWPLVHFGVALLGAVGLVGLVDRLSAMPLKTLAWAGVAVLSLASPLLASLALPDVATRPEGLVEEAIGGRPDALLNLVAPEPSERCRAAVPDELDTAVWSYTGYRLVSFTGEGRSRNGARIRWRRIYDHITPEDVRRRANEVLTRGKAGRSRWREVVHRFSVDVVVAPVEATHRPAFRALEGRRAWRRPYVVFRLTGCGT